MPRTKSAKKAQRQSEKRRLKNLRVKKEIRALIKKMRKEKKPEDFLRLQKILDKAADKGIIHKNKAARLKSRLSKIVAGKKEFKEKVVRKKKSEEKN